MGPCPVRCQYGVGVGWDKSRLGKHLWLFLCLILVTVENSGLVVMPEASRS